VIEQLLDFLSPFQIVALNINDIGYDNNEMFLRILNRRNCAEKYHFISLPRRIQKLITKYCERSRPLYKERSQALFLNRFGSRLTTRYITMRHGRTSQKLIERKMVKINGPCGESGIEWFNKWSRAHVVYFMQRRDGAIKVGHSTAGLATRFQTLETEYGQMKLLGLIEGDKYLERKIQRWFRHLCVEGSEWFRSDPELLAFIQRVVKEGHDGLPF